MILALIWIWKFNSDAFFTVYARSILFWFFFQKIEIIGWSWNLELILIWIWRTGWLLFCLFDCMFLFFWIGNTFFRLISVKNSKPSVEAGIWSLACIDYIKLDVNVIFFCFRLFPFSILMLTDESPISLLAETSGFYYLK